MSAKTTARAYRHVDAALIRATAHSDLVHGPWPGLDIADVERWCAWLGQMWAQPPVAEAISVASPALAARVQAVCSGNRPEARQVRRMVMSVARYLVRMTGRATPFGVFAGVASARFGRDVSARPAAGGRAVARADAIWLADVIARLESLPTLRNRLLIVANDLAVVRGQRLVVPCQPHTGNPGRRTSAEISVRYTRAVHAVIQAARSPIRGVDLIDKVAAEFSGTQVSVIEGMVAELVTQGVLITGLRPPSTCTDGLAHVLHRLDEVQAATIAEVAPLVQELRAIKTELQAASCSSDWIGGRARRAVTARMRAVAVVAEQPLVVDLRLDSTIVLPLQVAAEAEAAALALLRLAPHPTGSPGWRDFHARFLDRYGAAALVPVGELVDPTVGLGLPAHYRGSGRPVIAPILSERDERLLALAQQAALDGAREVVLDDNGIEALAVGAVERARPAAHAEMCVEVRARTCAALADGAFTLAVIGVSRTAGAMSGRFLDVLPEPDRVRMASVYGRLPVQVDGALPAQLSFPPMYPRTENVVRAPQVLSTVISLAEHRNAGHGRIPLEDLAVTADNDHLYLVSVSRRQVVDPVAAHAAARHNMPPIARFLLEITRARTCPVSAFDWGAAAKLPYLPRIRYGRVVLASARWRIPAGALPGRKASSAEWEASLAELRRRLRLPDTVYAGESDRRLRLNLDEPMDLAVLRAQLDGAGDAAAVSEAPTPAEHGWFAARAHEIVIPLVTTARPASPQSVLSIPGPLPLIGRDHGRLPGSEVLFAKLYGHPDLQDAILMDHLPALLSTWHDTPRWWFVRYRDPDPHLRLRLHLADGHDYGHAAVHVGSWAADLRQLGLIGNLTFDTYHPETGRYGSGAALPAAEAVFAADSAAVLTQLTAAASRAVHPFALTAASLVDLAAAMTGRLPAGMRWLIDHGDIGPAAPFDRAVHRQAAMLADPSEDWAALRAIPGGPRIVAAWQTRREAAAAYRDRLHDSAQVQPGSVLASLLHMHHARAHGIDPDTERLCHKLARATALAWTARRQPAQGDPR